MRQGLGMGLRHGLGDGLEAWGRERWLGLRHGREGWPGLSNGKKRYSLGLEQKSQKNLPNMLQARPCLSSMVQGGGRRSTT